jgi:hypothetical protein
MIKHYHSSYIKVVRYGVDVLIDSVVGYRAAATQASFSRGQQFLCHFLTLLPFSPIANMYREDRISSNIITFYG